jgi:transcriptional regulator with XRE-family HTH domain
MTVADRIKDKRIEMGLSQSDLAKRAGYCDKTAISKIENAGNNITMKQVRRIAEALNTTDTYLMGWDEIAKASKKLADSINPVAKFVEEFKIPVDYHVELTDEGRKLAFEIEGLSKKFDDEQVKRALKFAQAFLNASKERQQIVLDILKSKSRQEES